MLQAERQPLELGVSTRCAPEELSFPTSLFPPLAGGHVPAQCGTQWQEKKRQRGGGEETQLGPGSAPHCLYLDFAVSLFATLEE